MKKIFKKIIAIAMIFMMGITVLSSLSLFVGCTSGQTGGETKDDNPSINWEEKGKPERLIIKNPPKKMNYVVGECFESDGLVIDAQYEDGSVQENISYVVITSDPLELGEQRIRIGYSGVQCFIKVMVERTGNAEKYSVENTPVLEDFSLNGKTILWLGSSVTYGEAACGESMADFIGKRNNANCIKETVSGTTLYVRKGFENSYLERLENWLNSDERVEKLDAFVCQLSTNDRLFNQFGEMTPDDEKDISAFDTKTTFGAIEYIIALVKENYDCPILFYTNQDIGDEKYEYMVNELNSIQEKWEISVLDLYHDEKANDISEEEAALYLKDSIHPTRAGYLEWWTPILEERLSEIIK